MEGLQSREESSTGCVTNSLEGWPIHACLYDFFARHNFFSARTLATQRILHCGFGLFGFTRGDLRLQDAILGAPVDLLFANAVEARGVATCFGHDFLFS